MGFRHEDFKFRFVEATRLSPIVGFHSRFRWFSLRRPCGAFILHGIKEERRFIFIYFQGRGKTCGFAGENEGNEWELDSGKIGKRGIAKGYLGLQGTGDESRAMDESKEPLPCGEDMESDFKRLRTESVNATFESL